MWVPSSLRYSVILGLKERLINNPVTPCTFCFQQEPQFPPGLAEGARMILQPPVTQFVHEGARDNTNMISLETKLARKKPSMGLLLSLAVLCLLTHCAHVQLRIGEIICTGHPVPHSLNLTMEKRHVCGYWFLP